MNSFIKLKNGMVINLSQIECFGPCRPYSMLNTDGTEISFNSGVPYAIGDYFVEYNEEETDKLLMLNCYAVPLYSHSNDIYDEEKNGDEWEDFGKFDDYEYFVLLKSGRNLIITEAEYNNILEVMKLKSDNYSNVDKHYTKFDI